MDTSGAVLQVDSGSWSPAWKLAIERLREWGPSQDLTPRPGTPVAWTAGSVWVPMLSLSRIRIWVLSSG